jgi:hypothetical protein
MKFEATHRDFRTVIVFTEEDAPTWLTSANTIKGSTMDNRWFWEDHVLALRVGESTGTDFNIIKRIE